MRKAKTKKILLAVIIFLILVAVSVYFIGKTGKQGLEVRDIGIKELVGSTPEERLATKIDVSNARITKIEDVDNLRSQYSAIFKDAKNGNYVVELPDRILVYDFEHDEIISEFYVQNIDLGEKALK